MNTRTAAEIAGFVDAKNCTESDHEITTDERDFAIEIAHELAARNGFDIDAAVKSTRDYLNDNNQI